jgi:hypothetical protein
VPPVIRAQCVVTGRCGLAESHRHETCQHAFGGCECTCNVIVWVRTAKAAREDKKHSLLSAWAKSLRSRQCRGTMAVKMRSRVPYWPSLLYSSSPSKRCANGRSIASRQSILSSLACLQYLYLGNEHYQMIVGDRLKDGVRKSLLPRDQAFSRLLSNIGPDASPCRRTRHG